VNSREAMALVRAHACILECDSVASFYLSDSLKEPLKKEGAIPPGMVLVFGIVTSSGKVHWGVTFYDKKTGTMGLENAKKVCREQLAKALTDKDDEKKLRESGGEHPLQPVAGSRREMRLDPANCLDDWHDTFGGVAGSDWGAMHLGQLPTVQEKCPTCRSMEKRVKELPG
jgi:hypothetical protein